MRLPLWRRRQDSDLEEEVRSHLQFAVRDRIERGESPADAEFSARREFGNVLLAREITRDAWGWISFERFLQDLRYGARVLRKSPAFALIAILTLALGIGANTVLFSVVGNVLLAPLPFPHAEQLVAVRESKPNFNAGSISFPNFRDWRDQSRSFSSMAVFRAIGLTLTGGARAQDVNALMVSSAFFSTLGVTPVLGRTFGPGEDEIGAAPIAILGESLWRTRFAASNDVLGKGITLGGRSYVIVGVVPSTPDIAAGRSSATDVFLPIGQWDNDLLNTRTAGLGISGIARLRSGVTIDQARADMDRVTRNLAATYPEADKRVGATLFPLKDYLVGNVRPVLLLLQIAVGFVLLIACVNVANLLLARSAARQAEFATRAALGAARLRLLRQLLTESLLLAGIGGTLGLLLAAYGTRAALAALPVTLPRAPEIGMNLRVFAFTAVISLFAGVLFGVAPALRARSTNLRDALQHSGRSLGGAHNRTLSVFVVAQIAMALVLLVGAGLMVRSLRRLWDVNPGFDPHHVLNVNLSLAPSLLQAPPDAIRAAYRAFDTQLAATPGVRAAAFTWGAIPFDYDDERLFWIDGHPKPASQSDMSWSLSYVVGPDYLRVLSIPLLRGRFLTEHDDEHAPRVGVIDDVFARQYFPGEDPIGRRLHMDSDGRLVQIVGVVGHVKQWGLDRDDSETLRAQLYTPFMQLADAPTKSSGGVAVLMRYDGDTSAVVDAVRATSERISGDQVISGAVTMDDMIGRSLAARRIAMMLLAALALLALLLACGGLYGVVSYVVAQRTYEIGLRMALGADRGRVSNMVLTQGARLTAVGIVIGVAAALGLTRLMSGLLYGIRAYDPLTFASVAALLFAFAVIAAWLPARRAVRVDPMLALRHQ